MSSPARLPPLGASFGRWCRLAEVPSALAFPHERLKLDLVGLVLAVKVTYKTTSADPATADGSGAASEKRISSVTLLLWDGSGAYGSAQESASGAIFGVSAAEGVAAKKCFAAARVVCDVAEGRLTGRLGPNGQGPSSETADDAPVTLASRPRVPTPNRATSLSANVFSSVAFPACARPGRLHFGPPLGRSDSPAPRSTPPP